MSGITTIKRKGFAGGGKDASTTSFSESYDRQSVAAGLGDPNTRSRSNKSVDAEQAKGQAAADKTNREIKEREKSTS